MRRLFIAALALSLSPASGEELAGTIAATSGDFAQPIDATPGPDGSMFFFTAVGPTGMGIFRAPAAGGPATLIMAGAPFVSPTGVSVSSDGRLLYVADPRAWAGGGRVGQIFVLPAGGGAPQPLRGAEGRGARGIEVIAEGGQDTVYFTGYNPADRTPGVYKLPAAGASAPTVMFQGAPLVNPDGVAISRTGVVYTADRGAAFLYGSVYKIEGEAISRIVDIIRPGNPAGVALSLDESTLLVSTLQPYRNNAQVLIVDLNTLETSVSTQGIGQNPGSGGLHRARNSAIYAWCSSPMGPVFKIMAAGQ